MPTGLSFLLSGGCTALLERACKEDHLSNFFRVNFSPPCHVHSSSCMCETATVLGGAGFPYEGLFESPALLCRGEKFRWRFSKDMSNSHGIHNYMNQYL